MLIFIWIPLIYGIKFTCHSDISCLLGGWLVQITSNISVYVTLFPKCLFSCQAYQHIYSPDTLPLLTPLEGWPWQKPQVLLVHTLPFCFTHPSVHLSHVFISVKPLYPSHIFLSYFPHPQEHTHTHSCIFICPYFPCHPCCSRVPPALPISVSAH